MSASGYSEPLYCSCIIFDQFAHKNLIIEVLDMCCGYYVAIGCCIMQANGRKDGPSCVCKLRLHGNGKVSIVVVNQVHYFEKKVVRYKYINNA